METSDMLGIRLLESIGTAICVKGDNIGMMYPMFVGGGWDEDMGCHINDMDDEYDDWSVGISSKDKIIVDLIKEQVSKD